MHSETWQLKSHQHLQFLTHVLLLHSNPLHSSSLLHLLQALLSLLVLLRFTVAVLKSTNPSSEHGKVFSSDKNQTCVKLCEWLSLVNDWRFDWAETLYSRLRKVQVKINWHPNKSSKPEQTNGRLFCLTSVQNREDLKILNPSWIKLQIRITQIRHTSVVYRDVENNKCLIMFIQGFTGHINPNGTVLWETGNSDAKDKKIQLAYAILLVAINIHKRIFLLLFNIRLPALLL